MHAEAILWLAAIVAPAVIWFLMERLLPQPLLRIAKGLVMAWGVLVLILVGMCVSQEGFSHF